MRARGGYAEIAGKLSAKPHAMMLWVGLGLNNSRCLRRLGAIGKRISRRADRPVSLCTWQCRQPVPTPNWVKRFLKALTPQGGPAFILMKQLVMPFLFLNPLIPFI